MRFSIKEDGLGLKCITKILTIPIPQSILACRLGLVDAMVPSNAHRTLLNVLLFYARKAILLHWKKLTPPTVSFWKGLVNSIDPLP